MVHLCSVSYVHCYAFLVLFRPTGTVIINTVIAQHPSAGIPIGDVYDNSKTSNLWMFLPFDIHIVNITLWITESCIVQIHHPILYPCEPCRGIMTLLFFILPITITADFGDVSEQLQRKLWGRQRVTFHSDLIKNIAISSMFLLMEPFI